MTSHRLPVQPGELIDRDDVVGFRWNGAEVHGCAGDTIASALAAGGVEVFSRSFKYRRPRGILTADFHDPNLFVQVGDEPNVRAGHRMLAAGMDVTAQGTWPSLEFDARAANRIVGRFLSPGFYYKTFISPAPLRSTYQRLLRRFGAGGKIDLTTPPAHAGKRFAHPDVLVAGGGPAGMAAALAASHRGARVMLVEENHHLGGHLLYGGPDAAAPLAELCAQIEADDAIEVLTDSVVTGRYDHNWVGIVARCGGEEHLVKARAKCLVVAAGKIERPYVFAGNDLPGVTLSGAVRRLVNLYAVAPGTRAVVATANESGDGAVADLERVGVEIAEVTDLRRSSAQLVRAVGRGKLEAVELSGGRKVEADLLVTAVGWTTPTSLLNMAGDRPVYDPAAARFLPGDLPDDVLATGGVVGDGPVEAIVEHGRFVGFEAGRRALTTRAVWQRLTPRAESPDEAASEPTAIPELPAASHPELFAGPTDGFVDFSEDVKGKDLAMAAAEGYDSIELAKRYTTATMGSIQGKLGGVNAVAVHAAATGATIEATGTTTWRPPYAPITLGALAGVDEDPVRYSPMHDWHVANGATPIGAGQWIRPDHYGDPSREVLNTRSNVGIIDVSPLGKIELRGSDVTRLLDFVYTNRWESLDVGRVRYGVMCAEDGVVFDDGVTARLDEDRYYMTTTSSGAGRVWNWLDEWLQTSFPAWDVRTTAVTDGFAAMNIAGPRSRELLERVASDLDLSGDSFAHMNVRVAKVAGISDCIILRIGFTGELSYEVHVPAGYGLHVWQALVEAGADLGIAPFGLEAQRIMRLEKGHFIVGQDTDGLTKAHTAGLGESIQLVKDDFSGKPELVWEAESGAPRRLVAIQPIDGTVAPPEASQIVDGGSGVVRTIGRVTSSRMSPTLGRSVCLAIVDAPYGEGGATLTVRLPDGRDIAATVLGHHAHFDPEGERLRA
jgi:sarcosine oxidase subunit alpha